MFQDEKTTELDLNKPLQQSRWTEKTAATISVTSKVPAIEANHLPWLLKLAAAVTILILSLWLF
ncbi:MAG: hypothetical protein ACKN9V_06505 [Pseudomonadota bacterium]